MSFEQPVHRLGLQRVEDDLAEQAGNSLLLIPRNAQQRIAHGL
jgi:hypothetical protein